MTEPKIELTVDEAREIDSILCSRGRHEEDTVRRAIRRKLDALEPTPNRLGCEIVDEITAFVSRTGMVKGLALLLNKEARDELNAEMRAMRPTYGPRPTVTSVGTCAGELKIYEHDGPERVLIVVKPEAYRP